MKLNDVLVNAKCCNVLAPASAETQLTSASRNTDRSTKNTAKLCMKLNKLKIEILNIKMPLNICKTIMLFLDSTAQYAHHFFLDVCSSSWSEIKFKEHWTPNEASQQQLFISDWRGKYVQKKDPKMQCSVEREDLSSNGAPNLHCTTLNEVFLAPHIKIMLPFFGSVLLKNFSAESFFLYTEHCRQSFVIRSFASMIPKFLASQNDCQEQTNAIE